MFRKGSRLASFVLPRPGNRLVESDWIYLHRENIIGMGPRAPEMVGNRGLEWTLQAGLTGPTLPGNEHYVVYEPRTLEGFRGKGGVNKPFGITLRTERVDAKTNNNVYYGTGTMNSPDWAGPTMDSLMYGALEQAGGLSPYAAWQLNQGATGQVVGGANASAEKVFSSHSWISPGRSGSIYSISYDEGGTAYNLAFNAWGVFLTPLFFFVHAGVAPGPLGAEQKVVTRHSYRFTWMEED